MPFDRDGEPRAIPGTELIPITLPAAQWNTVLQCLAKAPYEVVNELMNAIQNGCLVHWQNRQRERQATNGSSDAAE
jgi:hypothetical protein